MAHDGGTRPPDHGDAVRRTAAPGSIATTSWPPRSTSSCARAPAALTMRRLATELDVGTPTIYWHVGSRDELVGRGRSGPRPNGSPSDRSSAPPPAERVFSAALPHLRGRDRAPGHHLARPPDGHRRAAAAPPRGGARGRARGRRPRGEACAEARALDPRGGRRARWSWRCATSPAPPRPTDRAPCGPTPTRPSTPTPAPRCSAEPDLDALTAAALRAVVDHHVPRRTATGRPDRAARGAT